MPAILKNNEWLAEAETAIRAVEPTAAAVVSAVRTFALPELGIESALFTISYRPASQLNERFN